MTGDEKKPILVAAGVSKRFGATQALKDAAIELYPGEVHLLLGENGAGKSTLIGILEGTSHADEGSIFLAGEEVSFSSPAEARARGIHAVLQTPAVVPRMTVAENLFLGEPLPKGVARFISRTRLRREAAARMEAFGGIDVNRPLDDYSPATHTLVAMARAFAGEPAVVLLDEPTAVLTDRETKRLFELIGRLRRSNAAIVFTTHRLEEARAIGDRVTVLQDGQVTLASPMDGSVSKQDLVEAIIGDQNAMSVSGLGEPRKRVDSGPALEVERMSGGRCEDVSLRIGRGEVVGLAGLVGSGRSTLAHLIYGSRKGSGTVAVGGKSLRARRSPRTSVDAGLLLCPEDRRQQALFMDRTIRANLAIAEPRRHRLVKGLPIPSKVRERDFAAKVASRVGLRAGRTEHLVGSLSGGNQQKVVIGRWLDHATNAVIFDEPTAGLDVGAKVEVASMIRDLCDAGAGVLLISSDLSEVAEWSDRTLVIRDGRLAGEVEAPTDEATLLRYCYGERFKEPVG